MEKELKDAFLKDEYLKLQDQYEDFDRRALQIKGWVAAGSIAAIALGFEKDKGGIAIWITVALFSLCFWYLEARWKMFQNGLQNRIRVIEAHFRGSNSCLIKDPVPLQIFHFWHKTYRKDMPIYPSEVEEGRPRSMLSLFWKEAKQDFVMLPYALIIVVCVVMIVIKVCSPV